MYANIPVSLHTPHAPIAREHGPRFPWWWAIFIIALTVIMLVGHYIGW